VNGPIVRLFGFCVLLFALLIGWTSRWTVFDATALQNSPLNRRGFLEDLMIKRGRILADNGEVLARSVPAAGGTWTRTYPQASLFSQAVGYEIARKEQAAGLEESWTTELRGQSTGVSSIFGQFSSSNQVGNDVYTTLDPTAQALARTELAGRVGSVVAIVPQTGAIKAMYSNPSYDDNDPDARCAPVTDPLFANTCQLNLATQARFPPGSTFKVVTTTAALDSGRYTPDSTIVGNSPITVSGVPLENDGNQSWGPVTLTKALTYSINTVYAQVGEALGRQTMARYMKRFGFYSIPPLDYPRGQMIASGERSPNGALLPVTSTDVDLGRMSIGQDKLAVTPLQMAMVVSAVADGGKLMTPRLVSKVVNPDGQTVQMVAPTLYSDVMKPSTAQALTQMMTDVVEEGTGQPARLEGVNIAGKTGTAQVAGPSSDIDDAWFIGFAPVQDPKIAVAVTLEDIPNGYGGIYAAPIAAQMIKTLLAEGA
jgi:penicillin-binding protein A